MKRYKLPYLNQEVDTVILANGEFPKHAIPLSILENCKTLICCDGAIDKLADSGLSPDAIVGDLDSISEENKEKYKHILHKISDQDTNDLTKAVKYCLEKGSKNITILGATGKREDHTIANISLLSEYIKRTEVKMISNFGVFSAINSPSLFESSIGQQVSIFSIDCVEISSQNLLYPIEKEIFTNWWQASLNEAISDTFIIETMGRTVIYRAFLD